MIPKHIERKPGNDNYRALALYAADAKVRGATGEKSLMSWHEGCLAEDYLGGIIEAEATQALNTRTAKEKTYHLMVSFRPEDEAKLTPEIFQDIEKTLAGAIGFSDHQRHAGVHKNTDNLHMHIAFNMINPVTFNRHAPFYDHQKLHKACRELEKKYGLAVDKGMNDAKKKGTQKRHVKAETIEAQTGQQSFYSFAASRKGIILAKVTQAKSWEDVHEVFLNIGLELKPKGNGLVIKDRFGKHAVKASDIDRGFSKSRMEKAFGPFIEATKEQITGLRAETQYTATPLHHHGERNKLFAQFQTEMQCRKAGLEAVKEQEKLAYQSNKAKWDEKRKAISKYAMLPAQKRQVLQEIKIREEVDLAASRTSLAGQKAAIRKAAPYTSWTKFLQHHAALGHETALDILRSKKLTPELVIDNPTEMYQTDLEAAKRSKERQAAVLSERGINQKHRRALLAVIAMRDLIAKEADIHNDEMKYRIDTKGTVIFYLRTGGTIRDSGSEIHFSPHDKAARRIAHEYAALKWGRSPEVSR